MAVNKNNTIVQKAHQTPSGAITLRVTDQSMFDPEGGKSYSEGDFVTVDPSLAPVHGSTVAVEHNRALIFRRLLIALGGKRSLQALNPYWPSRITEFHKGMAIVGVATGKWVSQ